MTLAIELMYIIIVIIMSFHRNCASLHYSSNFPLGYYSRYFPLLGSVFPLQLPKAPEKPAVEIRPHNQCPTCADSATVFCTNSIKGWLHHLPSPHACVCWEEFRLHLLPVGAASQHPLLPHSLPLHSNILDNFQGNCTL